MSAVECVLSFIEAWNNKDFEKIVSLLHEDVFYHNIPMEPIHGRAAVQSYLEAMGEFEEIDWRILNIAAAGDIVLTERIDNFVLKGRRISLPVMGTFEICDGLIVAWRDYFDLADYRRQRYG